MNRRRLTVLASLAVTFIAQLCAAQGITVAAVVGVIAIALTMPDHVTFVDSRQTLTLGLLPGSPSSAQDSCLSHAHAMRELASQTPMTTPFACELNAYATLAEG
jgi:hypothetical protein